MPVKEFAMPEKLVVTAQWDPEAERWVATSADIPGLVTEATTLDELVRRVLAVTPELLEDNAGHLGFSARSGTAFDIHIVSQLTMQTGHAA
jgi:predicted RNase H-like HicB family nuclease